TDAQGQWVMTIPEELLLPGENVIFATAEKDGVLSEQVEVARVVVDEPSALSRTSLIGAISLFGGGILLNLIIYVMAVIKQRIARPEVKHKGLVWIAAGCGLFSMLALASVLYFQSSYSYDINAMILDPQEGIVLSTVNDQMATGGTSIVVKQTDTVILNGVAPAGTDMAITLCDDQPLRVIEAEESGNWSAEIPVNLLPKADFRLSAQAMADMQLGEPHRLTDLSITSHQRSIPITLLLVLAYILLFGGTFIYWLAIHKFSPTKSIKPIVKKK
ncbi:MAG: hypothetical protein Q8P90_02920, partial [bacterium]|nr:hypothetical protein [bacterium]